MAGLPECCASESDDDEHDGSDEENRRNGSSFFCFYFFFCVFYIQGEGATSAARCLRRSKTSDVARASVAASADSLASGTNFSSTMTFDGR